MSSPAPQKSNKKRRNTHRSATQVHALFSKIAQNHARGVTSVIGLVGHSGEDCEFYKSMINSFENLHIPKKDISPKVISEMYKTKTYFSIYTYYAYQHSTQRHPTTTTIPRFCRFQPKAMHKQRSTPARPMSPQCAYDKLPPTYVPTYRSNLTGRPTSSVSYAASNNKNTGFCNRINDRFDAYPTSQWINTKLANQLKANKLTPIKNKKNRIKNNNNYSSKMARTNNMNTLTFESLRRHDKYNNNNKKITHIHKKPKRHGRKRDRCSDDTTSDSNSSGSTFLFKSPYHQTSSSHTNAAHADTYNKQDSKNMNGTQSKIEFLTNNCTYLKETELLKCTGPTIDKIYNKIVNKDACVGKGNHRDNTDVNDMDILIKIIAQSERNTRSMISILKQSGAGDNLIKEGYSEVDSFYIGMPIKKLKTADGSVSYTKNDFN